MMPLQYTGVIAEHWAVRQAKGLFDVSHLGKLSVAGADAEAALHHALTADVTSLAPGRATYALALEDSGAFAVLLEAIPAEAAAYVRERVRMLVYGIGAGPHVDGQLVISHDILGSFVGDVRPRFVRRYAQLDETITATFRAYADDVRAGRFPAPEHCYPVDGAHEAEIRAARSSHPGTRVTSAPAYAEAAP